MAGEKRRKKDSQERGRRSRGGASAYAKPGGGEAGALPTQRPGEERSRGGASAYAKTRGREEERRDPAYITKKRKRKRKKERKRNMKVTKEELEELEQELREQKKERGRRTRRAVDPKY